MCRPLRSVLSRLEVDPPVICADEAHGELRPLFPVLLEQSIVRQVAASGAVDCTECGRRCRVEFIAHESDDSPGSEPPRLHGFIHCPDCGIAEVPSRRRDRWEIDTGALLTAVFRDIRLSVEERIAGRLWYVGKANWAGRSREVWFVRACRRGAVDSAIGVLKRRPKAIVFAPTETGAGRWRDAIENPVISLESALLFEEGEVRLDCDYVEGRIVDAGLGDAAGGGRRAKKRAERAAKIEALEKEVIQHLLAARDHAFVTKDQTGEPQLLPRPTQKALGKRVGLSETDVSRCMKDEEARELRLYWDTALDLNQIMAWKRPISMGRKT